MTNVIFPALSGSPKQIAPFWEKEAHAASAAGFGISIITDQADRGALSITNKAEHYLYRGWLVKPPYYKELCQVASTPLNSYDDYLWSFEFPNWYAAFTEHETPTSVIYTADEVVNLGLEEIAKQISSCFDNQPLIIKDWLKSRKHEWADACFIKNASDTTEAIRVMSNFFRLQGREFYGGLVCREYLPLKKLGKHPISKIPLPIEFRTFFLHQKPLLTSMYWNNDVAYPANVEQPPQEWLEDIGSKLCSPFVALDIAQSEDGKWWVIEVNDGGCAGYPANVDPQEFYALLYKGLMQ
jgi:ATP-grasp domain, R2K clade family 3